MSRPIIKHGQGGIALITALLILLLLTMLAVTGLRSALIEEQVSGNQKLAAGALFAAEQGISEAIEDIFDGTITTAGNETNVNWSASGAVSNTGYRGSYTVRHLLTADGSKVEDDEGRTYLTVTSDGRSVNGNARRRVEVALALDMGQEQNVAGLIGCQGVSGLSNFKTSSYSSSGKPSDGDRGDVATTDDAAFLYLDASSDFDINGSVQSTGAVYIKSDALIRRDVLANLRVTLDDGQIGGSVYTNGRFKRNGGKVGGDVNQKLKVPDPVVEGDCDPLDIDSIFVAGDAIRMGIPSSGDYNSGSGDFGTTGADTDYHFNNFTLDSDKKRWVSGNVRMYIANDFTLNSNAQLILDADATLTIYMGGNNSNFRLDSNSKINHDPDNRVTECNPGGCPLRLKVWSRAVDKVKDNKRWQDNEPDVWDTSVDKGGTTTLDSNAVFYGVLYAPRAHVVLNSNAKVHGSARGRFVTADSNLDFTYDEDLDIIWTRVPINYELVYWSEQYPDTW